MFLYPIILYYFVQFNNELIIFYIKQKKLS